MRPDRKLVAAAIIGWLIGAACGTTGSTGADAGFNSQEAYTFAGCEDAGGLHCPNSGVFSCAIDTIASLYRGCSADADCALVRVDNCVGYTACSSLAVSAGEVAEFRTRAGVEVSRYCDHRRCSGGPSCAPISERAACEAGRCVNRISAPDAGHNPQADYSYAGCEDAGSYGCPNDQVLACALTTIRAKYDECQQSGDCVVAPVPNCIGVYSSCPPAAVNDAGHAAFLAEAAIEVDRYCDGGLCRSSPSCAFSYQQGRVDCVNGRCVAQPDVDAGT